MLSAAVAGAFQHASLGVGARRHLCRAGRGAVCARRRRDGRGRRARDEPFAPHAAAHRTHLSGKRPHRAGAVGELHPAKASRVFGDSKGIAKKR